jgi:DNA-binding NarL/FixJ family response regulator
MIRVLLVDDHQLLRDSLRSLLDAQPDIDVVGTAEDGFEALETAATVRPDVVLMDLSMPRMGGVEATRKLLEQLPGTQVVVLTSFPDQDLIVDSVAAGAVGYLLKDAAPEAVVTAVRSAAAGESPLDGRVARTLLTAQNRPSAGASPPESHPSTDGWHGPCSPRRTGRRPGRRSPSANVRSSGSSRADWRTSRSPGTSASPNGP